MNEWNSWVMGIGLKLFSIYVKFEVYRFIEVHMYRHVL